MILAEDETDGEQRHPFDGNCPEPGLGEGPRTEGKLGHLVQRASRGWMFRAQVTPRTNLRPDQAQEAWQMAGICLLEVFLDLGREFESSNLPFPP